MPKPSSNHPDRVETSPARASLQLDGNHPPGEDDRQDADRHVDVEDPPPALLGAGKSDQRAAEQRPDGGGDPDNRTEQPERPAPLGGPEQLLGSGR